MRIGKKRLMLSCLALLLASSAYAVPVKVNVLVCDDGGQFSYPRQTAVQIFDQAARLIGGSTQARPARVHTIVRRCNLPRDYKELYSGRQYGRVYRFFRHSLVKKDTINYAILPAITDDLLVGLGGASTGICGLLDAWNLSIVAISPINSSVGPTGLASLAAVEHEWLHNGGGAFHTYNDPPDIMAVNPMPYAVNTILPIAKETKEDVRYCVNEMRRRRLV